jgi:hypothetical protein
VEIMPEFDLGYFIIGLVIAHIIYKLEVISGDIKEIINDD